MPSNSIGPTSRLIDIRHNIYLAQQFVTGLDYETFKHHEMAFYAVTRCLEIISEASRHLSNEIKARHPDIPWRDVAGAGNIYRHDYEDVRRQLVWGTVKDQLPQLLTAVQLELDRG